MTEPSVEESVIRWDALTDKELGSVVVYAPDLAALIADWRKRGEALKPFSLPDVVDWDAFMGDLVCDWFTRADIEEARAAISR